MAQQFPILSFDQANPLLTGMQRGADLYKQYKMTPLEIKQAQYANDLSEQQIQKQGMYLQKYPELLAAELLKAQLEPEEMKARNRLMGSQSNEIDQRMQYNPLIWNTEIRQNQILNSLNEQKHKQNEIYLQKYPELLAAELSKAQLEPEEIRARNRLMGSQSGEIEQRIKYNPGLWESEKEQRKALTDEIKQKLKRNPELWLSEDAQRNALTKEVEQRIQYNPERWEKEDALKKAYVKEIEQKMQYNPELWSAETAQRKAQTEGLNRKNALIQDLLSGNLPGSSSNQSIPQGISNPSFGGSLNNKLGSNGLSYAQASLLSDQMGLPKPEIMNIDGNIVGITAFGNVPIAKGMSPLEKELTKEDAKKIGDLENNVFSGKIKEETLNELSSVVSNPAFQSMRQIPIAGKYELEGYAKFGTPEQKKLVGSYMTLTGQIIKDSARDFAGQFRIGEQALLNSMKPSLSDTYETAMGKIEALSLMNKMLTERSEITAQLMREGGLSLPKAMKEADKLMNVDDIRKDIRNRLQPQKEVEKTIEGKKYILKDNKVYEL